MSFIQYQPFFLFPTNCFSLIFASPNSFHLLASRRPILNFPFRLPPLENPLGYCCMVISSFCSRIMVETSILSEISYNSLYLMCQIFYIDCSYFKYSLHLQRIHIPLNIFLTYVQYYYPHIVQIIYCCSLLFRLCGV